jgi:DeoR family transcriptional regulator, aga operon transcriptional repressor
VQLRGLGVDDRRAWLLDHLGSRGRATVAELSELLGVSVVTVRTDLQSLAGAGLVRRVHGGAVLALPPRSPGDPDGVAALARPDPGRAGERPPLPSAVAAGTAREARAVGAAAAELVSSGDSLLVDGGPVATWLVRALLGRRDLREVTIGTNDLDVAQQLRPGSPRFSIRVAGGTVHGPSGTLVEPLVGPALERMRADIGFLSCVGVARAAGVSGSDLEHGAVWRRYLAGSERKVLLAPGPAVGHRGPVVLAAVDELDLLLTGRSADAAELADLDGAGLRIRAVG